jgi:plasmid rolling circle replication initiator protein Rep
MENIQKANFYKDVGKKLDRYKSHKRRSLAFVDYIKRYEKSLSRRATVREINLFSQLSRVEDCGSYLLYRHYYQRNENRLVSANFCKKHTLCGLCAIRRAGKGAYNLHEKAKQVMSEYKGLKAYFIVLTVKNEADLAYGMRKLEKGWQRIRTKRKNANRARKTKNPSQSKYASALESQFANVVAGAYSVEITFNEETQEWHPHMNLLLLSETEMDKWEISKEWKSYTGDSFIVDCQEKDPVNDKGVVCEIMKYAMKFSELPFEQNIEAYLTLWGKRLKGTIGEFYGVDLEPDPEDEGLEGEPYIEILLTYSNGEYREVGERRDGVEKERQNREWVTSDLIPI